MMSLALGRSPEEEPKENLHKVSQVRFLGISFKKALPTNLIQSNDMIVLQAKGVR